MARECNSDKDGTMKMKSLTTVSVLLLLVTAVWAGTRIETNFNRFQVCIQADPVGGINRVLVSGAIDLDNGAESRKIGYDIYPLLTAGQKAQLRTDFLFALRLVSNREDVPTPVPTSTP